ncbi:MAG: ABC transporter ATP-binding protein [Clostridia bacterium]|nr:ABC transporter ATP-binding protein [Clostridia bacterium]
MNISVSGINKSFGRKTVLKDLSFSATGGQCIGILGENGSGKSTLFSVLNGLQRGEGAFMCDGTDLLINSEMRSEKVGFVPQSPPLLHELTARDNLRLWYTKKEMEASLSHGALAMLGISEFLTVPVCKMSGGMNKRLSIGCAIAHNPQILLLDEPCSALDIVCKEKIYAYLRDFTAGGGIVVIATHDVYELSLCDDIYILKNGSLGLYEGDRRLECLVKCLKNEQVF